MEPCRILEPEWGCDRPRRVAVDTARTHDPTERAVAPVFEALLVDPRATLRAFLVYTAVGLIGTVCQYAILITLVQSLRVDPVVSSAVGFSAGAVTNYFANYYITFRSSKRHWHTLTQFLLVAVCGLLVNTVVMGVLTRALHLHYLIGQVVATGTVVVITFLANRLWTFREV